MVDTNNIDTSMPSPLKSGYCNAKMVAPKTFKASAALEAKEVKAAALLRGDRQGVMATSKAQPKTGARFPKTVRSLKEQSLASRWSAS